MNELGIGIDFGTTNSLAAVWGKDVVRLLKERQQIITPIPLWAETPQGQRPHPSVVWLKPDDSIAVGYEARQRMESLDNRLGHHFIRSVKRQLGQRHELITHSGQKLKAFEIAAEIFKHLKDQAELRAELKGNKVERCVVTVPVSFSGAKRREIRRAMERAELSLQTFLHEPFAALIAHYYDLHDKLERMRGKRVLVFDWGGGTLDVCLVEGSEDGSKIEELAHDGIEDRAGDDFDRRIMTLLRKRFLANHPDMTDSDIELRSRTKDRFWINSEAGKIEVIYHR